jgi:PAS domain S-box-containing protein
MRLAWTSSLHQQHCFGGRGTKSARAWTCCQELFALLKHLSDQVRLCYERAAEAKERADEMFDPEAKIDFLKMERRWLLLAHSYEFGERLDDFTQESARQARMARGATAVFRRPAPINILIADDEPRNLTVLEAILGDPGYRLVRAQSAEQALLALLADEFALLILDIRMPDMTGFELAKMIKARKNTANVPIVFLTADYNTDQHIIDGYDSGAVDYLTKPVNPSILRAKVATFAELHRRRCKVEEINRVLAAVVESSDDAILTKDLDGIISTFNGGAERLFGYKAEEVVGKSVTVLLPPDRQYEAPEILARIRRGERVHHYETVRRRKDGTLVDISLTVSPLKDDLGRIIGASKIARDLTYQRNAEAQMAADLRAMTILKEMGSLYVRQDLQTGECLQRTIDAAITIVGADKGNVQIFDDNSNSLVIAAYRGFAEPFLTFFKHVSGDASACAAAMQTKGQVIVEDVLHSHIFAGQSSQAVLLDAGVRAVASTPLMSSNGTLMGMISTHYANPHRPTDREVHLLQLLARQAADYLERKRAERTEKRLLQELDHRCNNLLAVVQAIANKSLSNRDTLLESD